MLILAWRNIWRNKRRSLITMSSIAFGVLFACLTMSVQYGSLDHMVDNIVKFYTGHLQIHQKGYWEEKVIDNSMVYSKALLEDLSGIKGVVAAVPRIEYFALAAFDAKTRPSMILGVDPESENVITGVKDRVIKGEYLLPSDHSVLMSSGLAEYLGMDVEDSVILIGQGYHGSSAVGLYPIKGLIKFPSPEQNNRVICMPVEEAQWFFRMDQRLTSVAILLDSYNLEKDVMLKVTNAIGEQPLESVDWQEMIPDLVQTVKLKHASSKKMIMVLYIVIGFGMFGTFLMMTVERKYEFGILLSIGMKRIKLQTTVFLEILLMSLTGVLLGVIISMGVILYLHAFPPTMSSEVVEMYESYGIEAVWVFSMAPGIFFSQAWAIFVIALILSAYPMLVLFRLKPVKAMREG